MFDSLRENLPTKIPAYDKSAYQGEGDRVDEGLWEGVNGDGQEKVKVVIFEGWCVGFRARGEKGVRRVWEDAVAEKEKGGYDGRLGYIRFEDVRFVDEMLKGYDAFTE